MRSAFVSVGAFALALSPLVVGSLPMTWSAYAWTAMAPLMRAAPPESETVGRSRVSIGADALEGLHPANREVDETRAMTASHPTSPLRTRVQVTDLERISR